VADYVAPIACDALANFTANTATGTGEHGIDTDHEQEGTGCYYVEVASGAGVAYSEKTLSSNIVNGSYWHLGFHLWHAKAYDFETPAGLDNANYIRCIGIYDTVNDKRLAMRVEATASATFGRQWRIISTAGTVAYTDFDPGWMRAVWQEIDMYGYIDNTAGWMQLWQGGTKWAEFTGADTLPVSDFNAIRVGINYRQDTNDFASFVFDNIVCDDEASPAPPGTVKPWWYYDMLKRRRSA